MSPKPADFIEHQVSPWLRLITPALLALMMFVLNSINAQLEELSREQIRMREELSDTVERVRANETAIRIYHGDPVR